MIKKLIITLLVCSLPFTAISCINSNANYASSDIFAMDTYISISYEDSDNNIITSICANELERIEKIFSKTIDSSEISLINNSKECSVSDECVNILKNSLDIAEKTEGAFNPAMGSIINLWDITGKKYIPAEEEISESLRYCSFNDISISSNKVMKKSLRTHIDLGACVKGYAAQSVVALLKEHGIDNAMISIGGNIAVIGHAQGRKNNWRVGIRNPFNTDEIIGYIDCTEKIISVSGDYERYFEKDGKVYHHIFDSNTGRPADTDIKSVAVIADDGLVSDSLSTALFCMGSKKALEFYNKGLFSFDAVIITNNGLVIVTDGIKDSFIIYDENSKQ